MSKYEVLYGSVLEKVEYFTDTDSGNVIRVYLIFSGGYTSMFNYGELRYYGDDDMYLSFGGMVNKVLKERKDEIKIIDGDEYLSHNFYFVDDSCFSVMWNKKKNSFEMTLN